MTDDLSKRITLRLPSELHEALTELARVEGRSLNNQIIWLLKLASDPNRLSDERLLFQVQWILRQIKDEAARLENRFPVQEPSPSEMTEVSKLLREHQNQELAGHLRTKLAVAISENRPKADIVAEIWEKLGQQEPNPEPEL